MENRLAITTLCAAALVYACSPWMRTSGSAASSDSRTAISRTANVRNAAHKAAGSVTTDLDFARSGSRVDFALRVANNTRKTVELRFPSALTHDVAVLDSRGRTVWRASAGRLYTQTMQALAVRSRDTLSLEDSWDASGAHGSYTAVAQLATSTNPIERRVQFTLP